jgi:predicted Zn finger-like uncharacterized protein
MLIVCPNCATSYQVEPSSLGTAGRPVRCVRCKKTWFAASPDAALAITPSHREDLPGLVGAPLSDAHVQPPTQNGGFPALEAPPIAPEAPETGPVAPGFEPDAGGSTALAVPVAADAPEAVGELPPVAEAPPSLAITMPEDIESVAARRLRRRPRRSSAIGAGWSLAILGLIALNASLVIWRADIVRFVPQTASLYGAIGLPVNLRGLVFSDIVTRNETQDGVPLLVVEGLIRSNSPHVADVPRLRFAVRNAAGQELHSWTAVPAQKLLAPSATMPFRSRLASPPPEAHSVLVRFFNRRDLVAGIQ